MSEPIRPWTTDEEKQDCEYHGFVRLARRLKETFPHLGICIVGDSLYACSSVMKICDDYNWDCIFTSKEGSTPKAYSDSSELMKAFPGNGGGIVNHNAHGKPYDGGAVRDLQRHGRQRRLQRSRRGGLGRRGFGPRAESGKIR